MYGPQHRNSIYKGDGGRATERAAAAGDRRGRRKAATVDRAALGARSAERRRARGRPSGGRAVDGTEWLLCTTVRYTVLYMVYTECLNVVHGCVCNSNMLCGWGARRARASAGRRATRGPVSPLAHPSTRSLVEIRGRDGPGRSRHCPQQTFLHTNSK